MKKNFDFEHIQEPMSKEQACNLARDLALDDAIRTIAKSGKNHDSGPNWYVEWEEGLSIGATFGAGTNNATVRIISNDIAINHLMLYSADSWGRCIETFRYGPWVHRLIAHAQEIRKADEAQHKSDLAAKAETDAAKFAEVDF